jgi:Na+-transporting NADH:ubiquinone oxidoreductase subunit C
VQRSNTYIVIFSAILTIVIGGIMSLTSVLLKPRQDKQVELDTKKKILSAVMDISTFRKDPDKVLDIYSKRVKSAVVDFDGNEVAKDAKGNPLEAEKINIQKNHKIAADERNYPVFMFVDENSGEVQAYILPMFGSGLWDWISGYIALEPDLNTIKGISFDHKTETPGLGARIKDQVVQERFIGKKIFDDNLELVSVTMVKGEGNPNLTPHEVDGLSGATMTAKGVNRMLIDYLKCYQGFMSKTKNDSKIALNAN